MCCIDRIIDFKPSSMPDLGISLDKVFYPGFDILITNDRVRVLFFITDSKSEIKMRIVKELRNGVAYNRAQNELYVWLTDDELLKMKGHKVLVEVEISDIFTNGLCYSTIETINVDPIVRKRCTYSTSFNEKIVDDLRSIEKFIKLDKTKSVEFTVDAKDGDVGRFMNFLKYGDCNQNERDDAIDALRYASEKWLKTKKDIIGKVTDIDQTKDGLKIHAELISGYVSTKGLTFNKVKEEIEKSMNKKTIKDVDRIVITKNDLNEVLLRAYSGNEIVEKTIAKCNPNDIFDFNIGAKLAVDRLYDGYDMTPKPKRKLYNGEIFVRTDEADDMWCGSRKDVQKVYKVTEGQVKIGGYVIKDIYDDMTDDDLTKFLHTINSKSLIGSYFTRFYDGYFVKE